MQRLIFKKKIDFYNIFNFHLNDILISFFNITPLRLAVKYEHKDIIRLLFKHKKIKLYDYSFTTTRWLTYFNIPSIVTSIGIMW